MSHNITSTFLLELLENIELESDLGDLALLERILEGNPRKRDFFLWLSHNSIYSLSDFLQRFDGLVAKANQENQTSRN